MWFILRFTLVKAFTNATTLKSNPFGFFSSSGLNPLSNPLLNPSNDNDDGRLLLLLFPKSRLLLLFPSPTDSNFLNRFTPIVPKYEKYLSLVFLILAILFCYLFSL